MTGPAPFPPPEKLRSRDIFRLLARSWPFIRPYRRHLLYLLLAAIPSLPVAILALSMFPVFFDVVGNGHPLSARQAWLLGLPLHSTRELVLWRACLAVAGGSAIALPYGMLVFGYAIWILQRMSNRFRVDLYGRLQELSIRFHAEEKIGDAIFRMFQDSAAIWQVINGFVIQPIQLLPFVIADLIWLAFANYRLAAIALAIVPADLCLAWALSSPLRRTFLRSREAAAIATTTVEETLASITAVKAFANESGESARYARDNWQSFLAARRARMTMVVYRVLSNTIRAFAYVAAMYFAAGLALSAGRAGLARAAISLGLFQGAMVAFARMSGRARHLTDLWGGLQDVGVALARVFEMLDKASECELAGGREPAPLVRESIAFDRLGFSYDGRAHVLTDVNLEARVGEVTAIVGESGSGKSTIVALALRFFDPSAGRVLLDGRDIRNFALGSWRSRLSVALQENPLFSATLRDNVAYGRPDATTAEVVAALELAQLGDFLRSLPAGLDTMLGEKGAKLSQGQADRIGIARAILRDAPILMLDEPTSALDVPTETRLMAALRGWIGEHPQRRMVLLATHRATAVAMADRAYRVEGGRVVACEEPAMIAAGGRRG